MFQRSILSSLSSRSASRLVLITAVTNRCSGTFRRYNFSSTSRLLQGTSSSASSSLIWAASAAAVAASSAVIISCSNDAKSSITTTTTSCDSKNKGADVVMLGPTAEHATGILFPRLCNGMTFVGCGVRVKWRVVKVYAVGTYVDPKTFSLTDKESENNVIKALLDPRYPRTIRIVMNRAVSMEKYVAAIIEAIKPRMNGQDLEKLEEFKKLNPSGDLVEGAVMEMTIRGDTLLYRNSAGTVGAIHSSVFTRCVNRFVSTTLSIFVQTHVDS